MERPHEASVIGWSIIRLAINNATTPEAGEVHADLKIQGRRGEEAGSPWMRSSQETCLPRILVVQHWLCRHWLFARETLNAASFAQF